MQETSELTFNGREMFIVLLRAQEKNKVPMTSEFFVYFSMFRVHDEKNTLPLSLPSSNLWTPLLSITCYPYNTYLLNVFQFKVFFCFVILRLLFSVEYKLPDMNLNCDIVSQSKLGCRYITDCFVAQQVFLTRHQYIYHSIITHPIRSVTVDKFRVRVDTSLRSYD